MVDCSLDNRANGNTSINDIVIIGDEIGGSSMENGTFTHNTTYTATITLAPKAGYTLTGVPANFFSVTGATSVSNLANGGVITAVFPSTAAPLPTEYIRFMYDGVAAEGVVPGRTLSIEASFFITDNASITMYSALYNKRGALVGMTSVTGVISNGTISFSSNLSIPANTEDGAYVKVFFWDSQTYEPIREAVMFK
jgi:hypothetical protein